MISDKKHHHVVVGVIVNNDLECLLAERRSTSTHPGCLEFPGGKCEINELPFDALCRELQEEIGIVVENAEPFIQLDHDYNSYAVTLDVWRVTSFLGEPKGCEGQLVFWQALQALDAERFPAGNVPLIQALKESLCTS